RVAGAPGTRELDNAALLELDCDILIPAALANQVHVRNAARINARVIVEGANAPVTPQADRILQERGIAVLPDILANSGGVLVSYYEWVQNLKNESWSRAENLARLDHRMQEVTAEVVARHDTIAAHAAPALRAPDLRTAALAIAIERLARITLERGIWP
ncbi:MAG: glutamate dehydrogenase, partial [Gammaproteobacteria bacterium]